LKKEVPLQLGAVKLPRPLCNGQWPWYCDDIPNPAPRRWFLWNPSRTSEAKVTDWLFHAGHGPVKANVEQNKFYGPKDSLSPSYDQSALAVWPSETAAFDVGTEAQMWRKPYAHESEKWARLDTQSHANAMSMKFPGFVTRELDRLQTTAVQIVGNKIAAIYVVRSPKNLARLEGPPLAILQNGIVKSD
jgi:hypothetical protein